MKHKKFNLSSISLITFILALGLSSCSSRITEGMQSASTEEVVELANPASVFCVEQGHQLEIRSDSAGNQYGICIFPDGSECDEWAFLRGECVLPEGVEEENSLPVVAWAGHVSSTPPGLKFDDYLILLPEGSGEIGLAGESKEIEEEIVALRDRIGPNEFALFWGLISCNAQDFGGCRLLVSQVRSGQFLMEPQPIENWSGQIKCSLINKSPNTACDNAFVLSGRFPVWFGIQSEDPQIQEQINNLRDTSTSVTISGRLLAGVPDVNGVQIQVDKLETSEP